MEREGSRNERGDERRKMEVFWSINFKKHIEWVNSGML